LPGADGDTGWRPDAGGPDGRDAARHADGSTFPFASQRDMAMSYSGDADRDFVAGMLPHHQGAVDMARVELAHGKDPAIRRLARQVIAAQEKEIAFMKAWQARHPAP
jgi:uncharacterized protein (DUF305 family)